MFQGIDRQHTESGMLVNQLAIMLYELPQPVSRTTERGIDIGHVTCNVKNDLESQEEEVISQSEERCQLKGEE